MNGWLHYMEFAEILLDYAESANSRKAVRQDRSQRERTAHWRTNVEPDSEFITGDEVLRIKRQYGGQTGRARSHHEACKSRRLVERPTNLDCFLGNGNDS